MVPGSDDYCAGFWVCAAGNRITPDQSRGNPANGDRSRRYGRLGWPICARGQFGFFIRKFRSVCWRLRLADALERELFCKNGSDVHSRAILVHNARDRREAVPPFHSAQFAALARSPYTREFDAARTQASCGGRTNGCSTSSIRSSESRPNSRCRGHGEQQHYGGNRRT